MRTLISVGIYNVDSPTVIQELRSNFYASNSNAKTPEKLVKQMRKDKNLARPKKPILMKQSNSFRLLRMKTEIAQRQKKKRKPASVPKKK